MCGKKFMNKIGIYNIPFYKRVIGHMFYICKVGEVAGVGEFIQIIYMIIGIPVYK
jgi:hypothetical protein